VAASTKKTEKLEVRLPSDVKNAFRERCEAAGLTASEAMRAFVEGRPASELLGQPQADRDLSLRSAQSHMPVFTVRRLLQATRTGSTRAMTTLAVLAGYGLLAVFVAMATLKPLWGDHVGLFKLPDGTLSAGIVSDTSGARELLGLWTIPIATGIAALLFGGLSKLSRRISPWSVETHT
jgi:hypothetical protein